MVLFGASALPKFARSIGQAKKELEQGMKEGYDTDGDAPLECSGKPAKRKSGK